MLTQTNNSGRAFRLSIANLARTQLGSRTGFIRLLVLLLERDQRRRSREHQANRLRTRLGD